MWKVEESPVVQEIPVFLSKELCGQLYMLQYPQAPLHVQIQDELPIISAKIKPQQEKVQLKVEIDTEVRYDKSRGENLQSNADGKLLRHDKNLNDKSNLLSEQILESVPIPAKSKSKRYVIGVVRNRELHLNPLHSIVQMQNKMWYMHAADMMAKLSEEMENEEEEGEAETTKVTVKFKQNRGGGGEQAGKTHPRTYRGHMMRQEDEPWTELDYYARGENLEHTKLYPENTAIQEPSFALEGKEYLDLLFPKQWEAEVDGVKNLFTCKSSKPLPT